jgi:hypothetical protein
MFLDERLLCPVLIFLLLWFLIPLSQGKSNPCGTWIFYEGSCYNFSTTKLSWQNAQKRCEADNAFLVTIDDVKENQFVRSISANFDFWIGLHRVEQHDMLNGGHFAWVSNLTSQYTNWAIGEPSDHGGVEDCVHVGQSSTNWNDRHCNYPTSYVCERALVCGTIPSLLNGFAHVNDLTYQSQANFSCQKGYNLVGASFAVCLANGTWNESVPLCIVVDCGDLSTLPNGMVYASNTTYQSQANFTCEDGYNLIGVPSALCLANGSWSEAMPHCKIVDCGDFPSPLNGFVQIVNTTYRASVNFTCEDGYNLVGRHSSLCLANSSWSNEIPQCIIVDCGNLPPSPNVIIQIVNTTYQSRVNFTCESGYNLVGNPSTLCLANGSWSNEIPQCISKM